MRLNVDPSNNPPAPALLAALGFTGVRFVSKEENQWYVGECKTSGLFVLGVLARESAGYVMQGIDMLEVGNEPDQNPDFAESSWIMTPDEYVPFWHTYRWAWPDLPMIVGGLSSGMPADWPSRVLSRLEGCSGIGIHPYAKTAHEAVSMLREYAAYGLPLYITEWWRPADQLAEFATMLREFDSEPYWFCWGDFMVPGMGLVDDAGDPTPAFHAMEAYMHAYHFGILAEANRLTSIGIDPGIPLEDETYPFPGAPYSFQTSSKGLFVYSVEANVTNFLAGAGK